MTKVIANQDGKILVSNGTAFESTGTPLPPLTNPASASDVMLNKEFVDGQGQKQTGTFPVFTGTFADMCNWITKDWEEHIEFTVSSATKNAITIQHNLGRKPTHAMVYPKTDFLNAFMGSANGTFANTVDNRNGTLAFITGKGLYWIWASRMASEVLINDANTNSTQIQIATTTTYNKNAGTYIIAIK